MPNQRLRITYRNAGNGSERPLGNLGRTWIDAFERAGFALARPAGSKRARIEMGPPLPQDATGEAELADALLADPIAPSEVVVRLASVLPSGLVPLHAEEIGERLPSLQASTRAACYRVTFDEQRVSRDALERGVAELLALTALDWQETRGERVRRFDLRALIFDLRAGEDGARTTLDMRIALSQERSARPASVLAALGLEDLPHVLVRTAIEVDQPRIAIRAWRERGRFE